MSNKFTYYIQASLFFSLFCIIISCRYAKRTPEKYKYYNNHFSAWEYEKDSNILITILNKMLMQNAGPFSVKNVYNIQSTFIYLDSILYSPDKKGMVIFVISKIDKKKITYYGDDTSKYFYNANYLFGLKDSLSNNIKLFNYGSIRFTNFSSYQSVRNVLMEYCFGRRATDHPFNNREPAYNMDDIRFWNGEQFNAIKTDTSFIHLQ